jgi:hypothetical protein
MKRISFFLSPLIVSLLIFSCGSSSDETNEIETDAPDTTALADVEELVNNHEVILVEYDQARLETCIDSIWECQKVTDKNGEWRELSDGETGLSMMQIDGEDKIFLDFGENNDRRFVNYWSFIVEPTEDYRISFYDVLEDKYIDFGEWSQE